jgi:Ca2+-binding RTX toxin-like protein
MSLFGKYDLEEFSTLLRHATFAFGKGSTAPGWDALDMDELGIDQSGTTFTSRNRRGKAVVVENGDELMVAFRGTDKRNDFYDYDNISITRNYYKQFAPLLERVADYAEENGQHVTFTGISLGGAVVNMIAGNSRKAFGKAFADSSFVGFASPLLTGDKQADVFNYGYENDPIYHIVPGSWGNADKANATTHLWLYKNRWLLQGDNVDDRLSNHGIPQIADALDALKGLTVQNGELLVDVLTSHSYVLFDETRAALKAGNIRHPWGTELVIVGSGDRDRIYGASDNRSGSKVEWIYGNGGNDIIKGHGGDDMLYGGKGNDRINGGDGADYMSGDAGEDVIVLANHGDRAAGGLDADTFVIANLLPVTAGGKPSIEGSYAARLYIDDFEIEYDVLDLRGIDGNINRKGHQELTRPQYARYDSVDGLSDLERGYVNDETPGAITIYEDKSGDTLIIINTDSDRQREIEIVLPGWRGDISADILY